VAINERIWLVSYNQEELPQRIRALGGAGYAVDTRRPGVEMKPRMLTADPPAAVVIDLSKTPSMGRAVALVIRKTKATRRIPLVFVGGAADKIQAMQALFPDAVYTEWRLMRGALRKALANPPADPVVGPGPMGGYSGRPLPQKLGIKPAMRVGLIDAPAAIEKALGELPDGAELQEGPGRECGLHLWFVTDIDSFARGLRRMAALAGPAPLWICWPKKSAGGTINQNEVRQAALDSGLVDYKVCALDATWTGLLFRMRR
jgi:hypothetical protein